MSRKQARRKSSWVWWALGAIILLSCISTVFGGGSNEPAAVVEVQAGHLRAEIGSIPKDATINVRKSDGTIDDRDGDLEELVKDALFWSVKYHRAVAAYDFQKATEYLQNLERTAGWLAEYETSDMQAMMDAVQAGER